MKTYGKWMQWAYKRDPKQFNSLSEEQRKRQYEIYKEAEEKKEQAKSQDKS